MGAAAPAVLGGAGLVSQFLGNQSAQKNANRAQAGQDALVQRQIGLFDQRFKLAMQALNSGQFDPTKAIARANNLSLQEQGTAQNNAAGSARVLGYKPGDTAPIRNQESIAERYRASRQADNFNIESSLRSQMFNAFDPSAGGALNAGISTLGNRENQYLGQIAPIGGGLSSLAQFYNTVNPKINPRIDNFSMLGNAVRQRRLTGPDRNNPFYR